MKIRLKKENLGEKLTVTKKTRMKFTPVFQILPNLSL